MWEGDGHGSCRWQDGHGDRSVGQWGLSRGMAYFCLYRVCWCLGPLGEGTSWACSIIHMGDVGGCRSSGWSSGNQRTHKGSCLPRLGLAKHNKGPPKTGPSSRPLKSCHENGVYSRVRGVGGVCFRCFLGLCGGGEGTNQGTSR